MNTPANKLSPIHPGELLREDMEALGLSARAITADTALRLISAPAPRCE